MAIDLFSGCGGLSLGLRQAGFKVVAALDVDPLATATYEKNHKRTLLIKSDIKKVKPTRLMEDLGLKPGELDLLAGCPPCQGFSTLRTYNGGRVVNEPLNDLVFEFLRFVRVFKPKAIMMENVPGLYADSRLADFCGALDGLRYRYKVDVLDASDYGVPQRRKRMILVASKSDEVDFAPAARRRRTVRATIGRLARPGKSGDPLHDYPVQRSEKVQVVIKSIPKDGGSRSELREENQLECHKKCDGFKDIYGRLAWDKPASTITGGCINPSKGRFLHPEQDRAITLREAALLQGFPLRYDFSLERGRYPAAQMIGNAFPPAFARHHAIKLYDLLGTSSDGDSDAEYRASSAAATQ